jgi:hypothetical protein
MHQPFYIPSTIERIVNEARAQARLWPRRVYRNRVYEIAYTQ